MNFIEQLQLLDRIDKLIARKGTGSARDLASKLGISRSSIFNYLDYLRQLGAEIEYCDVRRSYYYVNNQRPQFKVFSKSDSEHFYGGKIFFNFFPDSPEFLDWGVSPLYHVDRQVDNQYAGTRASFCLSY
jgi:biotin operon repressor